MASSADISKEELEELKQAFQLYDSSNAGAISIDGFASILKSLGIATQPEQIQSIVHSVDKNKDDKIDFNEFVEAMTRYIPKTNTSQRQNSTTSNTDSSNKSRSTSFHDEEELLQVFKAFDKNQDGRISENELTQVMIQLGENARTCDIRSMMDEADLNKDGYIDFDEFKKLMPHENF
ncbi:hypothetical protein BDF14DRAFT_1877219 [Spinellus fusiger]|nr:hypothetical protein BDF14DRAFT_1877219 [Spinellus fusiger]